MNADKLIKTLNNSENIIIYGAGNNAKAVFYWLSIYGVKVKSFFVTDKNDRKFNIPDKIRDVPVKEFSASIELSRDCTVLIATDPKYHEAIARGLAQAGFHNIIPVSPAICHEIYHFCLSNIMKAECNRYMVETNSYDPYYCNIFDASEKMPLKRHLKISYFAGVPYNDEFLTILRNQKKSLMDMFSDQYGEYSLLDNELMSMPAGLSQKAEKNLAVYMVKCHVDKQIENFPEMPSWIYPIQVGADLTTARICDIADNTGDNISDKNRNYCELTAVYWAWKNGLNTPYIGFCHYRRHFVISESQADNLVNSDIDAVLTIPRFLYRGAKREFVESCLVSKTDWDVMSDVLINLHPEYRETFKRYCDSYFFFPCNMFIMKRNWFNQLCSWLFSVLENIDQYFTQKGIVRNDRYMGYLSENLVSLFIMHNYKNMKISFADFRFLE